MNAASPTTRGLMQAKLEASGLTMDDAILLGMDPYDDLTTLDPAFDKGPGIRFTYTDPFGELASAHPGWDPYYRVRRLDPPKAEATGFDAQTTGKPASKKKDLKYNQPAGTGVLPYFPQNIDWSEICLDPDAPLVITEGEFKSAKACKEGIPCIGLGGIWSFKSADMATQFLDSLKVLEWRKRTVYIVFDADMKDNPNGGLAINALAEELYQRGAVPYHIFLPAIVDDNGEEIKTGLDDYLLKHGKESFNLLCETCTHPHGIAKEMWAWNTRYLHCLDPHCIVDRQTGRAVKRREYIESHPEKATPKMSLNKDNEFRLEYVSLASEIFNWPMHARIKQLVYAPGQPPLDVTEDGTAYNVWKGWGCAPVQGDIGPYQELMDHIFNDHASEAKWFKAWMAYQVQHPGVKLASSVIMIGDHGAGKSMLGDIMQPIFGEDNFSEVGQDEFFGQFNEWASRKQFVLANEVIVKDNEHRKHMSALKNFITRKTVTINEKYGLKYKLQDMTNIYMTANPLDSLKIENKERRYFIYHSAAGPIEQVPGFLERWDAWKANGGASALFYHLLHDVDTSWFNPHGAAMETRSRSDVMEYQRGDDDMLVREIMLDGLIMGNIEMTSDLVNFQHIFQMLNDDQRKSVKNSPMMLYRAFINAGAARIHGGTADGRLKIGGKNQAFIAIRNQDKWRHATPDALRSYIGKVYPVEFLGTEPRKGKF